MSSTGLPLLIERKAKAALGDDVHFQVKPRNALDETARNACAFTGSNTGIFAQVDPPLELENPYGYAAQLTIIPSVKAPVSRLACDPEYGLYVPLGEAVEAPPIARIIQADWKVSTPNQPPSGPLTPEQGSIKYVDCFLQTQAAGSVLGQARPAFTKSWGGEVVEELIRAESGELRTRIWYSDFSSENGIAPQVIALTVDNGQTLVIELDSEGEVLQARISQKYVEGIRDPSIPLGTHRKQEGKPVGTSATLLPEPIAVLVKESRLLAEKLTTWLDQAHEGEALPDAHVCREPIADNGKSKWLQAQREFQERIGAETFARREALRAQESGQAPALPSTPRRQKNSPPVTAKTLCLDPIEEFIPPVTSSLAYIHNRQLRETILHAIENACQAVDAVFIDPTLE